MDERMHETTGRGAAGVHRVDEREVRLAMDRLDLSERTLNVYRATAFLTALGITVSHDEPPTADDVAPDESVGDVANLIEVSGWLRIRRPAMSVDEFRGRRLPHVMTPRRAAPA